MADHSPNHHQAERLADALIHRLGLEPHPEGGHFRQTYCANTQVETPRGPRPASTAIFFLLHGTERSHWHRIASDEMWYFHEGMPLEVWEVSENGHLHVTRLDAESPQHCVPAGRWFGSRLAEGRGYALVSCGVAPGFVFEDFQLAGSIGTLGLHQAELDDPQVSQTVHSLLHPAP